jgi:hypothetical protein
MRDRHTPSLVLRRLLEATADGEPEGGKSGAAKNKAAGEGSTAACPRRRGAAAAAPGKSAPEAAPAPARPDDSEEGEERRRRTELRAARSRAAALLAVDREIGRRRGRHGGQQKPRERKLKRRRGGEDGDADRSKRDRTALAAVEAPPAVLACGRSSASQALRNPRFPTVTKRRHALQQQELELREIARKLRRHGRRRRQGAASPSRAAGQEQADDR